MTSADEMSRPSGVIHDIGYRRYTGPRLGRRHATAALYVHSVRTAFGLGRSAKAKIFPGIVIALAFAVAVVAVAIRAQTDQVVMTYLEYVDGLAIPMVLFLAVVGPEIVCRDLRARVLPLYFSRPLGRSDYALAKLAAMVSAVWLLLAAPLLLMFLGGLGYAAITAVVFGAFAVPLASLSSRRAVGAVVIAAAFTVTTPIIGVVEEIGGTAARQLVPLVNPVGIVTGLKTWIYHTDAAEIGRFGPLYLVAAVAVVGVGAMALILRYRKAAA